MKKQRKNTISRETAEKELPREEERTSSKKRLGNFEKRERPARKPRRDDKREGQSGDYKSGERKATRAPRKEGADGKPKRRNTRSRDEANLSDTRADGERKPRFEKRDSDRKPSFDKKSGDRKPRAEKNDYKGRDRKGPAKPAAGGGKDYFKNFADDNRKKRKEDFKIRKEDGDNPPPIKNNRKDEYKANRTNTGKRSFKEKFVAPEKRFTDKELIEEKMPLNKFISRAGYCSRREAADLIKAGEVKVNGTVLKEPGYKVLDTDVVTYQEEDVTKKEKPVYFLLNKAKDYITTTDDPEGRKTVMDLFKDVKERIFPVGRLDRNTTGLLLLTNDGHLTQKLSHPKFENKKLYQVKLDKGLTEVDFEKIVKGLELEDGKATVDSLAYTNPEDKKEVGIEIHIGKNRIVRRIFEELGYEVKHLDRVMYAGLTKKNLPRGKWRALTDKELIFLKHYK